MISERRMASGFPALWGGILPFLTPNVMRVFNETYVVRVADAHGIKLPPIPIRLQCDHPDLVAELAFQVTRVACERGMAVDDVVTDTDLLEFTWRATRTLIDEYEGSHPTTELDLTEDVRIEAWQLARNSEVFVSGLDGEIEFAPSVPGAGVIGRCEADVSVGETLFEVKTVNRNFQSNDVKQVLIYLALQAATGTRRWTDAGLFNPRRATWCQFNVDSFVGWLSGGRSPQEVFAGLIEGFARDVEVLS